MQRDVVNRVLLPLAKTGEVGYEALKGQLAVLHRMPSQRRGAIRDTFAETAGKLGVTSDFERRLDKAGLRKRRFKVGGKKNV